MNDHIIGIIGGMGPEATADLFTKIIKHTNAEKDQEHFRVVIDNNTKIPDRTQAILYDGESPLTEIVKSGKGLESLGVDVICIPCMTSHYYYEKIVQELNVPVLNIFTAISDYLKCHYHFIKTVGIVATSGTVEMDLFGQFLNGFDILYPEKNVQEELVMDAIYGENGIKAGGKDKPIKELIQAVEHLEAKGAEVIIMGCTEIGLVLRQEDVSLPLIDPLSVAAKSLIKYKR